MNNETHKVDALVGAALDITVPETAETRLREAMRESVPDRRALPWRLCAPLGAGAAALLVVAFLVLWGSGMTWANVQQSMREVPWVHVVQVSPQGDTPSETWYQTSPPRSFHKGDGLGIPVMYDFTSGVERRYWSETNTVVVTAVTEDESSDGCRFLRLLQPELRPESVESVERTGQEGGLVVFDAHLVDPGPRDREVTIRLWVDPKTKLPHRAKVHPPADIDEQPVEFRIDYPSDGPADLYDLGVPQDAEIHDARPAPDVTEVMDTYRRFRDAFPDEYRAVMARRRRYSGGSSLPFAFVVLRDGDYWRIESPSWPLHKWKKSPGVSLARLINFVRTGDYDPWSVQVCDGSRTVTWETGEIEREGFRPHHLRMSTNRNPATLGWPTMSSTSPVRRIESDDPELAGMIGLQFEVVGPREGRRDEYWLNPDRDYLCHRLVWKEKREDTWKPTRTDEILEYARTGDGHWYPALRRNKGEKYDIHTRIEVKVNPDFPEGVFDISSLESLEWPPYPEQPRASGTVKPAESQKKEK